ncbi:hypothetical protein [Gluconobacter oxydans]|uniref:Lipoprotein n=1 Tax=Gluconobacter oxydans TaxID=442 RepID=A0AB35AK65_GLUOY|nr:hypothetical protein [Gluconobacter oxydans]MBF0855320.1 hypothetical protein [Gluconobacter oxydans]MCP1247595.1 hypothetical protein [Gluconobacter oxydans]TCW28841.1 hypothetical protein EDC20_102152 [Gluconobacter oxydans]WKE48670.1 hypothetical protein NUJ38_02795 [Gluconobacter oxydans]GEC59824.1 hypothetical protein GOX01_01550 [Gluconobacter oxydans]
MLRKFVSGWFLLCGLAACQAYDRAPTPPAAPSTGEPVLSGRPEGMLLSPPKWESQSSYSDRFNADGSQNHGF